VRDPPVRAPSGEVPTGPVRSGPEPHEAQSRVSERAAPGARLPSRPRAVLRHPSAWVHWPGRCGRHRASPGRSASLPATWTCRRELGHRPTPVAHQLVDAFEIGGVGGGAEPGAEACRVDRRTHGRMRVAAARSAALVGFSATSNVEASAVSGSRPPARWPTATSRRSESELEAFRGLMGGISPIAPRSSSTPTTPWPGRAQADYRHQRTRLETRAAVSSRQRRTSTAEPPRAGNPRRGPDSNRVYIFVLGSLTRTGSACGGGPVRRSTRRPSGTRLSTAADAPYRKRLQDW